MSLSASIVLSGIIIYAGPTVKALTAGEHYIATGGWGHRRVLERLPAARRRNRPGLLRPLVAYGALHSRTRPLGGDSRPHLRAQLAQSELDTKATPPCVPARVGVASILKICSRICARVCLGICNRNTTGTTKPRSSGPGLAIGMTGFEPATSSSRTTRATKLRHIPMLTYQRILQATHPG